MPNLQKWVNLSFLACGLLVWVLLREVFTLAFDALGLNRFDWVISPADIAGIVIGFVTFLVLWRLPKANTYLTDVLAELAKVTWPPRKETFLSTGLISIFLAIATLFVLMVDSIWGWVVDTLLYR